MMTYQVYNCLNTTEVYEDRLYRCYGVFQESGLVYTAVRRLDLPRKVRTDTSRPPSYLSCVVGMFRRHYSDRGSEEIS